MEMSKLRNLSALVAFVLMSLSSAYAGSKDSGGDPYVQQFLDRSFKLAEYFVQNPFEEDLGFDANQFTERVGLIDQSIKDEKSRDLLEFTKDKLFDKDGVEKPAVFNSETKLVRVNRETWKNFNSEEKLIQVTLEVTGLMGVTLRYQRVSQLIKNRVQLIESIPLESDRKYSGPGRIIVGQNPSEFGNIQETDFIIEGGVAGSGDENLRQTIDFFQEIKTDPQLVNDLLKGWLEGRSAYMVIHSVGGSRAVLSSLKLAKIQSHNGDELIQIDIYSLMLEKIRQVYKGPCAGNAESLSSYERIHQCYLDMNTYMPRDNLASAYIPVEADQEEFFEKFQDVFTKYYRQIERAFATNRDVMVQALRDNLIIDYGFVMKTGEAPLVMKAALHAQGLRPDLVGPFQSSAFWTKTGTEDFSARRLNAASKFMAERSLVYYDHNLNCKGFDDEHPAISGPIVIEKEIIDAYLQEKNCFFYSMGGHFERLFYSALHNRGFWYDARTNRWRDDQKVTEESNSQLSEVVSGEEARFRARTEQFSSLAMLELAQKNRRMMPSLEDRLQFDGRILQDFIYLGMEKSDLERLIKEGFSELQSLEAYDERLEKYIQVVVRLCLDHQYLSGELENFLLESLFNSSHYGRPAAKEFWRYHYYQGKEEEEFSFFLKYSLLFIDNFSQDEELMEDFLELLIRNPRQRSSRGPVKLSKILPENERLFLLQELFRRNLIPESHQSFYLRQAEKLQAASDFNQREDKEVAAREMISQFGLGATTIILNWFDEENFSISFRSEILAEMFRAIENTSVHDYAHPGNKYWKGVKGDLFSYAWYANDLDQKVLDKISELKKKASD